MSLQTRAEHRVEQLNTMAYGAAWDWLPTPLWLTLVDPSSDGAELKRLTRVWSTRGTQGSYTHHARQFNNRAQQKKRASLPVINQAAMRS
jgi:hypothetical protein